MYFAPNEIADSIARVLDGGGNLKAAVATARERSCDFLGVSFNRILFGSRDSPTDPWAWSPEDPTCSYRSCVPPKVARSATEALERTPLPFREENEIVVASHYLDDDQALALFFPVDPPLPSDRLTEFLEQVATGFERPVLKRRATRRPFSIPPLPLTSTNLRLIAKAVLQRFSEAGFHDVMISIVDRNVDRAIAASGCFRPIEDLTYRPMTGNDILVQAVGTGERIDVEDCWADDSHCDKYALRKCEPPPEQMTVMPLRTDAGFGWKRSGSFGTIQIACRFPLNPEQEGNLVRLQREASESLCFAAAANETQSEAEMRGLQARILLGTGEALQQPSRLDQALDELLDHIITSLQASTASVHMLDDRFGCTYCRAGAGPGWKPEAALARKSEADLGHPVGHVLANRQPLLNPDTSRPDYPCADYSSDVRSFCCVPVRMRTSVQGVLLVESAEVRAFTVSDIEVLQVLASLIGGFIIGGDTVASDRARSETSSAFWRDEPWDSKLQKVVEVAASATRADGCSLFLKDDFEAEKCLLRATTSEPFRTAIGTATYVEGEGRTGWVLSKCKPLRLPARITMEEARRVYGQDLDFAGKYTEYGEHRDRAERDPDICFLAVPIPALDSGKSWGVIRCAVRFRGSTLQVFTQNREELLQRIASEVGAALDRRCLSEVLMQQRGEAMKRALRSATERVAHKLKNPVGFLLAAVDNYLHDLPPNVDPESSEQLERIAGYARRIGQVADDLTRFLMPPKVSLQPMNLAALVLQTVAGACADTGYTAVIPPPPASWPPVRLDRSLCQSILEEVIRNAQLAMPDGGCILVEFSGPHEPGTGPDPSMPTPYITFAIADTGPGVPADFRSMLFQPYRTTRIEGTGLGLAIVRNYVMAMGGDVWEDGPKSGACGARFRFAFPLSSAMHREVAP